MIEDTTVAASALTGALGLKPELAHYLPLETIRPSPYNPRKRFDEARLNELADSIASQGVMQAIVVRKVTPTKKDGAEYEIVAGERRWRACSVLVKRGFNRPHVIPAFIRELDDFQAREVALTENSNRHDLHPLEEAQAYENLLLKPVGGGDFTPPRLKGYTVEQLADKIGHKPNFVFGRLKLLQLVPAAREAFLADKLQLKIAEALARLPASEQERAVEDILRGWGGEPYTHRQAIAHLRSHFMLLLKSAPFGITDKDLVAKAGPCTTCPKRSGASPDLFGENADDMCLDSACFEAKKKAQADQVIAKAREQGKTVLVGKAAEKVLGKGHPVTAPIYLANSGHVDLDKPAPELTGSRKPLRSLLGDEFNDKTIVLQAEGDDQPTQVAKVTDVKAVLKEKGLLVPSTKAAPGKPSKQITPADIKAKRDERIDELLGTRLQTALAKHLASDGSEGFPAESEVWLRWLATYVHEATDASIDAIESALNGGKVTGRLVDSVKGDNLARMLIMLVIGTQVANEFYGYGSTKRGDETPANALAKDIGFDLPALRSEIAEEVDAAIRDEIQALADVVAPAAKKSAGAKKVAKAAVSVKYRNPLTHETWSGKGLQPKWLKVALEGGKTLADFAVSTPASDAAAQGTKSPAGKGKKDQLTPEKALADAVAKEAGVDRAKLEAKPTKGSSPKTIQKDETAQPPTSTVQTPKVGERWKVRTDVKRRAKTAGREGTVDSVRSDSVTLRWGPKAHELGVYDVGDLEFVSGLKQPTLSPVAAWPFPTGPAKTAEAQA